MRLRQGIEAGMFSGGLAISLGLHLALAALVLVCLSSPRPQAPPVLTVSLVAPAPGPPGPGKSPEPAGGSAGRAAAPGTPPAPLTKQAAPAPKPRVKSPRPKTIPMVRSEPEMEEIIPAIPRRPAPVSVARVPVAPPVAPAPAPPAVNASGTGRGGSGSAPGATGMGMATGSGGAGAGRATAGAGTGSGSGGAGGVGRGSGRSPVEAQRQYLNVIRSRILAKRHYPPLSRQRREEGVVRLRFTLSAGGALAHGVQMVQPSGFHLLDSQAQQCVMAASPFPPFPPELRRDCLTVEVPIVYKLTEMGM